MVQEDTESQPNDHILYVGSSGRLPRSLVVPRTSTAEIRFQDNEHADVIPAKDGVIGHVINRFAASALDELYKGLAHESFFYEHVMLTGLTSAVRAESGYRISNRGFGRALPVLHGEIPFSRMLGNVVIQKGGGISGWIRDRSIGGNDPDGFFGKRDAQKEIDISNALIRNGFRSSLVLGYTELDPEWIINQIQEGYMQRRVSRSLNIMKENGDAPVVLFRVDGSMERMTLGGDYFFSKPVFRADLQRSARLMLHEADSDGSRMQAYIDSCGKESAAIADALSRLARRQQLSESQALSFFQLHAAITAHNAIALERAVSEKQSSLSYFPFTISNAGKDIDLACFAKDYELAEMGEGDIDYVYRYIRYMAKAGDNLSRSLKKADMIPRGNYDIPFWLFFSRLVQEKIG